jgi:ABC-type Fe3+-hydroxamate transport system substrate-binding protein
MVVIVAGAECLVGRSHECNYPTAVLSAPILTGAHNKFQNSRQMNDAVNEHLQSGKGLYWVDGEKLGALKPDVIVTQSLCQVCSVDVTLITEIAKAVTSQTGKQPDVHSLNPWSLQDVLNDCRLMGKALCMPEKGEAAAVALQVRIDKAKAIAAELNAGKPKQKVRTLTLAVGIVWNTADPCLFGSPISFLSGPVHGTSQKTEACWLWLATCRVSKSDSRPTRA